MRTDFSRIVRGVVWLAASLSLVQGFQAMGQSAAGYSEYYIPGDETQMRLVFHTLDSAGTNYTMHSVIAVTAWSANTTVYWDHWEDSLDFDPNNPATADETVTLATAGAQRVFESSSIPTNPRGTGTFYDGGDRMYVAGGTVTVTRATWIEAVGAGNQSAAWEIYPVKPQLTTYILTFGENLNPPINDFERVFVLIQATANGTTFTVDLDGNGTPDVLNQDRNADKVGDSATVSLNAGQTFLLDRISACTAGSNCLTAPGNLNTGAVIQGSSTLQVKFVSGRVGAAYAARGFSAFPRGYWTKEYYAPLGGQTGSFTDYYIHNPHATALDVAWETRFASGSFSVPSKTTVSFRTATGTTIPNDTALYFSASEVFWGVGSSDAGANVWEWGYSLLPSNLLYKEHYLGWAPGSTTPGVSPELDDVGVFLTVAQDNTRVYVDFDNDGVADLIDTNFDEIGDAPFVTLDRLQTYYFYDPNDGDLSRAHFWATGDFTMAFGENSARAPDSNPSMDLGYVAIPGTDFVSLVLTVDKTANPEVVPTASGSTTTFTIDVDSQQYNVDGISIVDTLPPNWEFVPDSAVISLPNQTTVNGAMANPTVYAFRERFGSAVYSNNGDNTPGTATWVTDWNEQGEGDDGPSAGNIRILADGALANALQFRGNGDALARIANLSAISFTGGAILNFKYRRNSLNATTDWLDVQVCQNATNGGDITCAATWTQVLRVAGATNDAAYQTYTVDLSSLLADPRSATFGIRFSTVGSGLGTTDFIWIDDVEIVSKSLTWPTSQLSGMTQNQRLRIAFQARTTAVLPVGTLSKNNVTATGTRTVGVGATQTFEASDFAFVASGQLEMTKSSSVPPTTPLYPGDAFTYTVTVTNPAGAPTLTGISVYDTLPVGVSHIGPVTSTRSTVGDRFRQQAYNLQDGSNSWNANWTETADGGTSPTAGDIQIVNGELRLDNSNSNEPTIVRSVNLSGATNAVLSFRYRTATGVDAADAILVQAAAAGSGGPWTLVSTITGIAGAASGTISANLSPHISATTAIRFAVANGNYEGATEFLYVDDLFITYDVVDSNAANSSIPDLVYGPTLLANQSLTLTIPVRVDNPLPSGIDTLLNVASVTTREFPIALTASATNIVTNPSALSASAAGRVWFDTNGDGVDDLGEPGISNVAVTLKDEFGTPIATMTTDSNGRYLFADVLPKPCPTPPCPAFYFVEVASGLPAGVRQTYPSGHCTVTPPIVCDNRTNAFYLAAGENKIGLDLGYAASAGTVAFGDQVWVDTNSDGTQNPGEVGLSGVTLTLYRDANGNNTLQPGTDTLVGTAVSAADGSYLFTGITPASGTYFVVSSTPAGYTATTSLFRGFVGVTADSAYLSADFGFSGTTFSLFDRVWLDADGDGVFDAGENGIGGVTADILDSSLNVIGTAVTAADGTFSFSGLTGGSADYTVRITDTAGVLADFTGTTDFARNRERSEPNLTADVDRRSPCPSSPPPLPPCPSYGFRPTRAIGDTLFYDADGDGVQDTGEGGIPGVTVNLYSDSGVLGVIDGSDAVIRTLTTDAAGQYLFSGLTNGNYLVSVPDQTGYNYSPGQPADSDAVASGIQRAVTMAGSNVLTVDFGFEPNEPRAVSGTIWQDSNRDGLAPGSGETGLAGVLVEVLSGSTVVAAMKTDSSGSYSFSGLANVSYTVRVTDSDGVLTSYEATWEVAEGLSGPFNYEELVNLTGGNVSGVNFGYDFPTPTYATIAYLDASIADGTVVVEWRTSSETGTVGFNLFRLDSRTSTWIRINDQLLPGLIGYPQGGTYRFRDVSASTRDTLAYKLIEIDSSNVRREYGPYQVTPSKTTALAGAYERTPSPKSSAEVARLATLVTEKTAADTGGVSASGPKAKILTHQAGLHFIDAGQIAGRLGLPVDTVAKGIQEAGLRLENRGRVVSYLPAVGGSGLYFYAERLESPYSAENAYLISQEPGQQMDGGDAAFVSGKNPVRAFLDTLAFEEDRYPLITISHDPAGDLWAWDYLYAGYPGLDTKNFTARVPSPFVDADAILTVRLHGASDPIAGVDHEVNVTWNGTLLGTARWDGLKAHEVTFPIQASNLRDGDNTLTLSAVLGAGIPYSLVYLDSFDLRYSRSYRAVNNELEFSLPAGGDVTVSGFSVPNVLIFNVTDPTNPVPVWGARLVTSPDGTYGVRLATRAGSEMRFLATTFANARQPIRTAGVRSSSLGNPSNSAEYVLIAPDFLAHAAGDLVTYRSRQGLSTRLVSLESIYDEFNDGISSPLAIRKFLRYAGENWQRAPRYVTLIGRGTFDYKDVSSVPDNITPTLLAPTPTGLSASDLSFLDLETESGRKMSIGRLPVLTSQELTDYIEKIGSHESGAGSRPQNVLLTSDNPDASGDFLAGSESVGAYVPAARGVERVYLSYVNGPTGKQTIIAALNSGTALFNYVGHGGLDTLAHENLFSVDDVAALRNAGTLNVFVAISCSAGNFAIPGYPSLAESLLLSKNGGSAATWTASGLSSNDAAIRMNQRFFDRHFVHGEKVLGDLVRQSLQDVELEPSRSYVKAIYNILGEPVSKLP